MKTCNLKPLQDLRILNTRPAGQNRSLQDAIVAAGGQSIALPTISIEPLAGWAVQLPDLSLIDKAIFTSSNAVNIFFSTLSRMRMHWPETISVIAIGQSSAASLRKMGIHVDAVPAVSDSEHLLQLPIMRETNQKSVLLVKGENGRTLIADSLNQRGTHLIVLDVYRRSMPSFPQSYLNSLWNEDRFDIILVLSEQSLRNLFSLFGLEARAWLCTKPCLVISERLAKIAQTFGMGKIIMSRHDRILNDLIAFATSVRSD
ncbi:uroporphyrinogen-III synthase [Legionella londiniensis]|uniref:Uroporphyrinogen-III synthase n=1 Tax=Legionella londiniensis TaxID=45068 RepID=A0A0W0VSS1_9GAMM|nr:uroporphyrinogen-III synthase [Legionella londiniensis]KTD23061.1 uroporphyrinogen-III synthase [Legionella londiniensis]STX94078.1 uroporphyrinogen III methylase [Legionella londiniensis]